MAVLWNIELAGIEPDQYGHTINIGAFGRVEDRPISIRNDLTGHVFTGK